MIVNQTLRNVIIVGTTLQLANALVHHLTWFNDYYWQFGGMFIAGVAGLLYAREVNKGFRWGALGGAIAGMVCATVGVALSVTLHDAPALLIPAAMILCTLTGAIGGLFGQLGAVIRSTLYSKR
ncbi:MAG: hypothetical protein JOZ55_05045 [Alphaproteobacteria bacterium]|nr:hypothetical protein [Alphaproteobacteria bacterium]